nr:MAG TPA: hypothetical protein [Caudoviricetes sp.]
MAIAGRVAIVPNGDWSADATYKRLDAVTYNNTLYFAKKEVPAGTATSNTEYWSKSIVGGVGAIATTEDAGVVKPDGKSMSVDESGTLSINLDGTTITLDEAKNVIKLADTLKDKINGAFPAANLINNLTTTEAGFGLDARQGKALDDKITEINGSLKKLTVYSETITGTTSYDASFSTGLSCNSVIVLNAYTNDSNGGIEVAIVSVEDGTYYARCYDKSDGYLTDKKITIHIDYILRRME